jgi:hypothetical protein
MSDATGTTLSKAKSDWLFLFALFVFAALLVPKTVAPQAPLYLETATTDLLLAVTSATKLCFLLLAAVGASRTVRCFEGGNPARRAWQLLAIGLGCYAAGQSALAVYQFALGIETPFPSLADLFFVLAMLLLVASLGRFIGVYREVGMATIGNSARVTVGVSMVGVAVTAAWLLGPVIATPGPWAEQALNLLYPLLDLALLLPCLLLLAITLRLRGGRLWTPWLLLLSGVLCLVAGDILYAYTTYLGQVRLDPLLDLAYIASYAFFAWGTARHHRALVG